MELVKSKCKKDGLSSYTDLTLVFEKDNRVWSIRVRPVFWRDMGVLSDVARNLDKD